MIDSIKARVPRHVELSEVNKRREAYKQGLPPLIFQNIYVTGVNESQKNTLNPNYTATSTMSSRWKSSNAPISKC